MNMETPPSGALREETMIDLKDITKTYRKSGGMEVKVLQEEIRSR